METKQELSTVLYVQYSMLNHSTIKQPLAFVSSIKQNLNVLAAAATRMRQQLMQPKFDQTNFIIYDINFLCNNQ